MENRRSRISLPLVVSTLLLGFGLTGWTLGRENARQMTPAWELPDLGGKTVQLYDFRGRIVVLNFWATWCPPCRREIPALIAFQKQYADKGVTVIGVAMDENGLERVANFAKRMGINYPVVLGDGKTAEACGGIEALPTTFILGRNGAVVSGMEGEANGAILEKMVKPLLDQ
jgi:thiol-disulfide isomerase/thioredoxin